MANQLERGHTRQFLNGFHWQIVRVQACVIVARYAGWQINPQTVDIPMIGSMAISDLHAESIKQ